MLKNFKNSFFSFTLKKNISQLIRSKSTNITFNLAYEDYIFEHKVIKEPILYFYQNSPTIVIGKHQNPYKECNLQVMEKNNVNLSRRRTGGGCVYHDLGNLCFCFISPYDINVDFKIYNTTIITSALKKIGIDSHFSARNDILVGDKKISGSAYKIKLGSGEKPGKALHHGTILLDINLDDLKLYLNPHQLKLLSKGVDSVRSSVINLREINKDLNSEIIFDAIEKEFLLQNNISNYERVEIAEETELKIPEIKSNFDVASSWEWKFGETPEFNHTLEYKFDFGLIEICLNIVNLRIQDVQISSDTLNTEFIDWLRKLLSNYKGNHEFSKTGIDLLFQDFRSNLNSNDENFEQFSEFLNILNIQYKKFLV